MRGKPFLLRSVAGLAAAIALLCVYCLGTSQAKQSPSQRLKLSVIEGGKSIGAYYDPKYKTWSVMVIPKEQDPDKLVEKIKADLPGYKAVKSSHRFCLYSFYSKGEESICSLSMGLANPDTQKDAYDWPFAEDKNGTCVVTLVCTHD